MRSLFLAFALVACARSGPEAPKSGAAAAVPVRVEVVAPTPLERTLVAAGAIEAVDSAALRPEMSGLVEAVLFQDGATVRRGQPLVRLRAADAQAALLDAEARATLAALELERTRTLLARGDVAQADLDRAVAQDGLARAAVRRAEEGVRRTTVVAPFDGVVGRREVSPGELVDPSRTITRVEGLERLVVDVTLAEVALATVATGQAASVVVEALPGATFAGTVAYVGPRVREDTRTVDVRVAVEDPERRLRPGLTATATIVTARVDDAVLVPTQALVRAAQGPAVWVVGADGAVAQRPVRTGERTETRVEVVEGLVAGDSVVIEGLARLKPGAKVEVSPDRVRAPP